MKYRIIFDQTLDFPFDAESITGKITVEHGTEEIEIDSITKKNKNGLYEILGKKHMFKKEKPQLLIENVEELNSIKTVNINWKINKIRCSDNTIKDIYIEIKHDVFFKIENGKDTYVISNVEHPLFQENETEYIDTKDKVIMFMHDGQEKNEDKFKHKYIKGIPNEEFEEEFYLDQIMGKEYDPDESFSIYCYYTEYMIYPEVENDKYINGRNNK